MTGVALLDDEVVGWVQRHTVCTLSVAKTGKREQQQELDRVGVAQQRGQTLYIAEVTLQRLPVWRRHEARVRQGQSWSSCEMVPWQGCRVDRY